MVTQPTPAVLTLRSIQVPLKQLTNSVHQVKKQIFRWLCQLVQRVHGTDKHQAELLNVRHVSKWCTIPFLRVM